MVERKLGQDLSSTESWSALTARREALLFWGGRRGEDSRTSGNGHIVSRHGTGIKQENTRIRATELLVTTTVCDGLRPTPLPN